MELNISITGLRAQDSGSVIAVTVTIESCGACGTERDVRTYRILPEQYASLKPRKGPIDRETVDELERASGMCEAVRRGMSLLTYGSQSERTLRQKLRARGFDAEQAAAAASYLHEMGLMDESTDAMRVAEQCRRKRWGLRRILSCLYEKGYPESAIRAVQDQLEGEDFVPDCIALIHARYHGIPEDRGERQKMTAALMRYGYALNEIRQAMDVVARDEAN